VKPASVPTSIDVVVIVESLKRRFVNKESDASCKRYEIALGIVSQLKVGEREIPVAPFGGEVKMGIGRTSTETMLE
jgi:hypothetical protein